MKESLNSILTRAVKFQPKILTEKGTKEGLASHKGRLLRVGAKTFYTLVGLSPLLEHETWF